MTEQSINNLIVEQARRFVGVKEKKGNMGWENQEYEELILKYTAWKPGQAWCMYAAQLSWLMAYEHYQPTRFERLKKLFSGSVITTYNNFLNDREFKIDYTPVIGGIMIFQYYKDGKPQWQGHAGIIENFESKNKLYVIEGNSDSDGDREGDSVMHITRNIDWKTTNGLKPIGIIYPLSKWMDMPAGVKLINN